MAQRFTGEKGNALTFDAERLQQEYSDRIKKAQRKIDEMRDLMEAVIIAEILTDLQNEIYKQ